MADEVPFPAAAERQDQAPRRVAVLTLSRWDLRAYRRYQVNREMVDLGKAHGRAMGSGDNPMHLVAGSDSSAGGGSFLFIPFFIPLRVFGSDRINFQYRLRGAADPVSRDLDPRH